MDEINPTAGNFLPLGRRYGIDRPAIDYCPTAVHYLNTTIYQRPTPYPPTLRNYPQWARDVLPLSACPPWGYDCICNFLASPPISKNRSVSNVIKWFPDGRRLLGGTTIGELAIWNGTHFNFEDIKRLSLGGGAVSSLEWSPKEDRLFVGDALGQIIVLSLALNPLENGVYEGLSNAVKNVSLSPSGDKLTACADSCYPIIWDVQTRDIERYLRAEYIDSRNIVCIDWHPSKAWIATGSSTNWLHLWDPRTAKPTHNLQPHKRPITTLKWNSDGNTLITCSKDTTMKLWDIRFLKQLRMYKLIDIPYEANNIALPARNSEPLCVKWNPIQKHVFVVGDSSGGLSFWSINNSTFPIFTIARAHGQQPKNVEKDVQILSIDWHPLGHMLASSALDKQIKFWSRGPPGCVTGKMIDASILSNSSKTSSFPMTSHISKNNS